MPVEDKACWVRAVTTGEANGKVQLQRKDTKAAVEMTKEEFAKLSLTTTTEMDDVVDDLTQMTDVSDATMLDALRRRYARDDIYTAIGPVIISCNPYKKVGGCSAEAIAELCKQGMEAPPHVTRVAYIAYTGLVNPAADERQPQSILISGESGAGKTEACKLCLLSLAELSKSSGNATEAALEAAVLMEAFGNAKTVYNNNSSRFGKWCAVYFDHRNKIAACQCEVYLLEKTRIINAPPGERNYHIFYQMQIGASDAERKEWKLESGLDKYAYTKTGSFNVDGVDDKVEWEDSCKKLETLGIAGDQYKQMMKLIAANLAIGNIEFEKAKTGSDRDSTAGAMQIKNPDQLKKVCDLLEVEEKLLNEKMVKRLIKTKSEEYTVMLKESECIDTRDALAKQIYSELFEWIVVQLNDAQKGTLDKSSQDNAERFIGLLDIFGFENFKKNSFEQLCINFTNEKLQAHFMDSLVKLRLEEYSREGIDCEKIQFPDNVKQLTLLDHKSKGVFALLDDQCRAPGGSDQGFVDNCHQTFMGTGKEFKGGSCCYDKPKKSKGGMVGSKYENNKYPSHGGLLDQMSFIVVHFAEAVCYTAEAWLDKNRGYLHPDVAFVLTQSDSALLRELFPMSVLDVTKKSTVGSIFRKSLRSLSATMLTTSQNYVRCIKPNGEKVPDNFDGHFSLRQLRYTGVASVVAIQRSGYPISMTHSEFVGRYRCIALTRPKLLQGSAKEACTALIKAGPEISGCPKGENWLKEQDVQIGVTKVYFRDEIVRKLEQPRLEATRKAAIALQRRQRGKEARLVCSVLLMHSRQCVIIREMLEKHDTDKAGDALEVLSKSWEEVSVPLTLSLGGEPPLLAPAKEEVKELGNEITELEEGLEAEASALADLQAALTAATEEGPKEAFVKLKLALQGAQQASRGLRPDLAAAMAMAEEALVTCLTGNGMSPAAAAAMLAKMKEAQDKYIKDHHISDRNDDHYDDDEHIDEEAHAEAEAAMLAAMEAEAAARAAREAQDAAALAEAEEKARVARELAEWEAEGERQKIEKERAHRAMLASTEQELIKNAAGPDPSVVILTLTLSNDVDMSTAEKDKMKQLVGYTEKSTGATFSDKNTVAKLRKGGLAALQGMLHVHDTIIAVNGQPLKGERVAHAMNADKLPSYELTVARSTATHHAAAVRGEMQGWVYTIKAKDGSALPLKLVKKKWAVLDAKANLTFYDKKRDDKPGRVYAIKGGEVKTPVRKLRGQELKQPPVIDSFIKQMRFPMTLTWPNEEVPHDVVMATVASEERSEWTKALNKTLKALRAQAPTSGWLVKKGGRAKQGMMALFSTNKRRWFVLIQPEQGADAIFRYYDGPPPTMTTPPKGAVVINNQAVLEVSGELKNSFAITSKGDNDPHPITTILAAETNQDMGRWMKAIHSAIGASGGKAKDLKDLNAARKEEAMKLKEKGANSNNLRQLAKLDVEELRELPLRKLKEVRQHTASKSYKQAQRLTTFPPLTHLPLRPATQVAEYIDVVVDPKLKDKKKIADLIMGKRNAAKADAAGRYTDDDDPFGGPPGVLSSWGSTHMMFGEL